MFEQKLCVSTTALNRTISSAPLFAMKKFLPSWERERGRERKEGERSTAIEWLRDWDQDRDRDRDIEIEIEIKRQR